MSSETSSDREQEVKFFLTDFQALQTRLERAGARLVQPNVHEFNLRFDTRQKDLGSGERVLRLRQDTEARLTYKGPSDLESGVTSRQEIEVRVSDFAAARRLFEALGYETEFIYEKYRATYSLEVDLAGRSLPGLPEGPKPLLVTLDQLPYGEFAEIEGPDSGSIRAGAALLALDWEARILHSYAAMFKHVKSRLGLDFRDLTFANFQEVAVAPDDLGVVPADAGPGD